MIKKLSVKDYQYLIIGGTTKAATTSLFFYLKNHPRICAANRKETRFFLDAGYPVPPGYRFEDGLDKYNQLYSCCTDMHVRMEATPDYLYSRGTPKKIQDSLPEAKIVFILREPVSRLISWYKFAKQINDIPGKTTFEEYVDLQLKHNGKSKNKQCLLALEQGRYSTYLKQYFELFGRDRIHVVFYEDLSNNPASVVKEICTFANIDPTFYNNYDFKAFNRSETMRNSRIHSLYIKFRFSVRKYTSGKPYIHGILRHLKSMFEPFYLSLNTRSPENLIISPATKDYLRDYYREEYHALEVLLGKCVPWEKGVES
ncbi:MAG: hypothetical protein E3K32_13540 [wastewater metagenome]|nr:hypothetical protein [Candidatus Loosdrechtia aerotolerans]